MKMVCQTIPILTLDDHDEPPNLAGRDLAINGLVEIMCGIHVLELALAGLTIEEIWLALRSLLNLERYQVHANGQRVEYSYIASSGDRIEFVRAFGRKGLGTVWTKQEFMEICHMSEVDWANSVAEGLPFDELADGTTVLNETEVDEWNRRRRNGVPSGLAIMERLADAAEQIANHLDPESPQIVGTPYVAKQLGKSVKWVGDLVRRQTIPKGCVVPGTGNGKEWRFFRKKIDKWIESR